MWRETKILLIDDDSDRRRDLTVILNFLSEDHLACSSKEWRDVVASLESSRSILSVLLGEVSSRGGVVDPMSYQYLAGAEVDYQEGLEGSRFVIKNPNATTTCGCGQSFSI